jgi:hypothetical protein
MWTVDSRKALRFARKQDAETYIDGVGWTEAFASEHEWEALAPPPRPPPLPPMTWTLTAQLKPMSMHCSAGATTPSCTPQNWKPSPPMTWRG